MAMIKRKVKYPVGVQSFEKIRTGGALYVDKTGIIAELIDNVNYAFLSRPRRFGKSLLLSTIEAYFLGKKHLFEGLEISQYVSSEKRNIQRWLIQNPDGETIEILPK